MDKAILTNPEGEGRQEQGSLPLLTHFRTLRCGKCICKRLTPALAFSKVYTLTYNELERFFCQRDPCSLASLHSSKIIDQRTSCNIFPYICGVYTCWVFLKYGIRRQLPEVLGQLADCLQYFQTGPQDPRSS